MRICCRRRTGFLGFSDTTVAFSRSIAINFTAEMQRIHHEAHEVRNYYPCNRFVFFVPSVVPLCISLPAIIAGIYGFAI
jgi:hypothetical protein